MRYGRTDRLDQPVHGLPALQVADIENHRSVAVDVELAPRLLPFRFRRRTKVVAVDRNGNDPDALADAYAA